MLDGSRYLNGLDFICTDKVLKRCMKVSQKTTKVRMGNDVSFIHLDTFDNVIDKQAWIQRGGGSGPSPHPGKSQCYRVP